ncbi:gamma-glutamyl-gamma-aminobutyrate hydrolase family protein [Bauldia sp.]|uniref:gamma-glutamyl-gamma-aminobutyrate hydrolase family protein n=1 Tax=Bauldia sp. TaxID=2575872 RepID=UPI003BABFD69
MTHRPLVGVPADVREADGYRWHAAAEPYLTAIIKGAGGIPVVLPALADHIDAEAVVGRLDGVLLTGSRSNVHPDHYGGVADAASEPHDTARDAASFALIRAALRQAVPVLAICRGMQELNVALGGTLHTEIHEIEGRLDHKAPDAEHQADRFAIRQPVTIASDGVLAPVLGAGETQVNSLHRQGVADLAPGLAVEATAPDGTVEAVRVVGAPGFAIGVQWHPEYWVETDTPSQKLFAAFGDAVRAHAAARGG